MLTTIQGTYNNGVISFDERPPIDREVKILVTFLEEIKITTTKKPRKAGGLQGQVWMSEDFNEPLEDLKAYM